ncbi:MAG TPA: hypothetical protein PKD10_17325 [Paracoccaceae bacterium]|nr:hypothetical protein [Paracoccaceae bacterium]HMO73596.1 hypothetical protein [Paracoccaceae bacterium]
MVIAVALAGVVAGMGAAVMALVLAGTGLLGLFGAYWLGGMVGSASAAMILARRMPQQTEARVGRATAVGIVPNLDSA